MHRVSLIEESNPGIKNLLLIIPLDMGIYVLYKVGCANLSTAIMNMTIYLGIYAAFHQLVFYLDSLYLCGEVVPSMQNLYDAK